MWLVILRYVCVMWWTLSVHILLFHFLFLFSLLLSLCLFSFYNFYLPSTYVIWRFISDHWLFVLNFYFFCIISCPVLISPVYFRLLNAHCAVSHSLFIIIPAEWKSTQSWNNLSDGILHTARYSLQQWNVVLVNEINGYMSGYEKWWCDCLTLLLCFVCLSLSLSHIHTHAHLSTLCASHTRTRMQTHTHAPTISITPPLNPALPRTLLPSPTTSQMAVW